MCGSLVHVAPAELTALQAHPEKARAALFPHHGGKGLSIEKMWHALHFLLTDDPWHGAPPLGLAILGGTEFGEDLGYGPARFLTPEQVRAVSAALSALTHAELRQRFDPAKFDAAQIYPNVWDEDPDDLFEELSGYFDALTAYYREASEKGHAMLTALT
jgi:hypothetical protein